MIVFFLRVVLPVIGVLLAAGLVVCTYLIVSITVASVIDRGWSRPKRVVSGSRGADDVIMRLLTTCDECRAIYELDGKHARRLARRQVTGT